MATTIRQKLRRVRTLTAFVPDWLGNRSDLVANAELRLTWRCNARCVMCDIWRYSHDHDDVLKAETGLKPLFGRELATDQARRVIDQIMPFGLRKLTISGGEPTLRRDLADVIHHASGLGLRVHINSNGTTITPERALGLVEAGLQQINLSVDGPTKEVHDAIRGDGLFDKTVESMKTLKGAAATLGRPFHLHLHCVVMQTNYRVLDQFVDNQEMWGWDSLSFGPMLHGEMDDWQQVNTAHLAVPLTAQSIAHVMQVVAPRLQEKCAAKGLAAPQLPFGVTEADWQQNAEETYCAPHQWCTVAWFNTTIQPNGDVIPCGYAPNSLALGNVIDQPFGAIYNNPAYRGFRASCKPTSYAMCRSCLLYRDYNAQSERFFRTLNGLVSPFRPTRTATSAASPRAGS